MRLRRGPPMPDALDTTSEDVELPEKVESLPDSPARLTMPLRCGDVEAL